MLVVARIQPQALSLEFHIIDEDDSDDGGTPSSEVVATLPTT